MYPNPISPCLKIIPPKDIDVIICLFYDSDVTLATWAISILVDGIKLLGKIIAWPSTQADFSHPLEICLKPSQLQQARFDLRLLAINELDH